MRERIGGMLAALLVCGVLQGQTAYQIPFGSKGNTIELAVENTSSFAAQGVSVRVEDVPSWLRFHALEKTVGAVASGEERDVLFVFDVEKSAVVREARTVRFQVTSEAGQQWVKEVRLAVDPPDRLELYQNYPNPFNPSTVIGFQLPEAARVRLTIVNLLGEEVAVVLDERCGAGYRQVAWNASRQATGLYVAVLEATDDQGRHSLRHKPMMLVK